MAFPLATSSTLALPLLWAAEVTTKKEHGDSVLFSTVISHCREPLLHPGNATRNTAETATEKKRNRNIRWPPVAETREIMVRRAPQAGSIHSAAFSALAVAFGRQR